MTNYAKGMLAGLAGTLVLSALMLMKAATGLMPELDVIRMIAGMLDGSRVTAWIAHLFIGIFLWGLLFAWLDPSLPSKSHTVKGLIFGLGAWVIMMVVLMPGAGAGLFGLQLGVMGPIMTAVLHIIYGAVLGGVYGWLLRARGRPVRSELR